ncbi:hypothetical protein AMELA_G00154600 [Ameiurus melas]|uniref:DZF domain-containing protein n=1 Tax=Ameiurus melas TaxID=219545 RepID=A0A7J6AIE7_AMEME|nr:hypothetical protein AMELA_G00154600 [Ameiurus melas]
MVESCRRAGAPRRPIRTGAEDHVPDTVVEMQAALGTRESGSEAETERETELKRREREREGTWMVYLRSGTERNSLGVVSLCNEAEQRGRHGQKCLSGVGCSGGTESQAHEEGASGDPCPHTQRLHTRAQRSSRETRPPAAMRSIRSFGNDDRHVMAKHSTIYPSSEALEAIQSLVSTVECALKHVSDWMDQPQSEQPNQSAGQEEETEASADESAEESTNEGSSSSSSGGDSRVLCGVMRIGLVAKGLLIKDDMDLELVLMCREKPTHTLLRTVCDNLPLQIEKLTEEKYEVESSIPKAAILIRNTAEPKLTLKVTLTSPQIRRRRARQESAESVVEASEPSDLLDRQRCLVALASLRHAKWFQARVNGLKSGVIVLRILRDMCNRVPAWEPLKGWPLELLCEKAIATCNRPLGAGEALRRVMECLASGILLPGGPGLHDPCEKEPTDTLAAMTDEQAEAITYSAQVTSHSTHV